MKYILFILAAAVYSLIATAQTTISGGIYANTTWTAAGSPYIITGDVVVFDPAVLTIAPNTEVRVQRGKKIEIRGSIRVRGTSDSLVYIHGDTASNVRNFWAGFVFTGTTNPLGSGAQATFEWCRLSDAQTGLDLDLAYHGPYIFRHCTFTSNTYVNADGGMGGMLFDSCSFSENYTALRSMQFGGRISNCTFNNNVNGADGTDTLVKCTFTNHSGIAVQPYGYTAGCTITSNAVGVQCYFNDANNTFINNKVTGNGVGVVVLSYFNGNITFRGNELCNTQYDIKMATANNCSIPGNCWCSTDSAAIRQKIYDGYTDVAQGIVSFTPVSTNCTLGVDGAALPALSVTAYPNPVMQGGSVTLKTAAAVSVQLRDMMGRGIDINTRRLSATGLQLLLPTGMSAGMYIIEVTDGAGRRAMQRLDVR